MISSKFQIVLIVGITLILLYILNMIRKRKLELKYSLVWFLILLVLLSCACMPAKMQDIAEAIGIYSPVNMIFFLGIVFLLVIVYVLTVTVSRLSARVRRLAQIVAMLNRYMGEDESDGDDDIRQLHFEDEEIRKKSITEGHTDGN